MPTGSYDIYFRGELVDGADPKKARAALASLFKANDATLEKLFSGKLQVIKRGCDKATASKYQKAMRKAGVRAVITVAQEENDVPSVRKAVKPQAAPAAPKAKPPGKKAQNAAERIAALAARPDIAFSAEQAQEAASVAKDGAHLSLAPRGALLLERDKHERSDASASDAQPPSGDSLTLAKPGVMPVPAAEPPAPAPDTEHMSMGGVGDTIPTLPRFDDSELVNPDTSAIDICPPDTGFHDLEQPVEDVDLDLSEYTLAQAGAELGQMLGEIPPPPPNIAHIELEP